MKTRSRDPGSRSALRRLPGFWAGTLLAAALATAAVAHADPVPPGKLPFVNVGVQLGRAEIGSNAMTQDAEGYLWIASDRGVYRFDGRHALHEGAEDGLPGTIVTQIAAGRDGVIWCVAGGVLARRKAGRWTRVEQEGLRLDAARHLAIDPSGLLWVTTADGLARERDDGGFERDPDEQGEIHALWTDASGTVWIAGGGRLERRGPGGELRVLGAQDGLPSLPLQAAAQDGRGNLWIAAKDRVLVRRAGAPLLQPYPVFDGRGVFFVAADRHGTPWIGVDGDLFWIGDDLEPHRVEDLEGNAGPGIFEDREGNLWVLGRGLHRLSERGLWRTYSTRDGLPSASIWGIRRTDDGALWTGTQRGLARAVGNGWLPVERVPTVPIVQILPDETGALWLGGPIGRVFRYDPGSDVLETIDASRGVPQGRTPAMARDARGTVWIGAVRAGLSRSEGEGDALHFVPVPLGDGAEPATVRDLVAEPDGGRLWIASDRGLFVAEADRLRRFSETDGLKQASVAFLVIRKSGEICVAYTVHPTPLGASCFRADGDRIHSIRHIDRGAGLTSDVVYLLAEDMQERLWVGGDRGVDMLDGTSVMHFDAQNGLPSDDVNAYSFWSEANGDVWIGTSRGLARFLGGAYRGPEAPPTSAISATFEGPSGPAHLADGRSVPHGRAIDVEFSALSFVHPALMQYEQRLLGTAAGAWRPISADSLRYDSLAPGTYAFEIRARHPGGQWGPPAALRFEVTPAWWQTWWIRGLAVCALAGVLWFLQRRHDARLVRQNQELERLVAERTREVTEAHAEVARAEKLSALGRVLSQLSHELNNPINVVVNNVPPLRRYLTQMAGHLAQSHAGADTTSLDHAWKAADLDFVIEDSADALSAMETAAKRIQAVQSDLQLFLRNEASAKAPGDIVAGLRATLQMVRRTAPRDVTIDLEAADVPLLLHDVARINQVLLNLLQNAIDAVGAAGKITVRVAHVPGEVRIEIEDDGPGIPEALRTRIFEPFFTTKPIGKGTGLGLSICRQIVVEQHGGTLSVRPADPHGAVFIMCLPEGRGGDGR